MGMPIPPTGATTIVAGASGATPPISAVGSGPVTPPPGVDTSLEVSASSVPGHVDHAIDAKAEATLAQAFAAQYRPPGHAGCTAHANAVDGANGAVTQGGSIDAAGGAGGVSQIAGILASLQQLLQRLTDLLKAMGGGAVQQGATSAGGAFGAPLQQQPPITASTAASPASQSDSQAEYSKIQNMFNGLRDLRL